MVKTMLKKEFENLIGISCSDDLFFTAEWYYMRNEQSKQEFCKQFESKNIIELFIKICSISIQNDVNCFSGDYRQIAFNKHADAIFQHKYNMTFKHDAEYRQYKTQRQITNLKKKVFSNIAI